MLTEKELLELIKSGENSRIEFKSVGFRGDSLAKEIVAFANMNGGDIFIGIGDDGLLENIEKGLEEKVVNICRNNIQPSIIPEITPLIVSEKRILRISVEKGRHKPYKVKSSNKFYIRAGSVSIEPSNEELARLFQDGRQLHFEISPLFPFTRKNFDLLRFRDYVENYRGLSFADEEVDTLLYNLQCTDEEEQVSVVGALFFATDPSRFLPQSGIDLNSFDGGDTSTDLLDYRSENCSLVHCIEYALEFVKNHTTTRATFDSNTGHRIETPAYEPFVVREIVVNAFMHRDWSIFGQKVRVNLFPDRLEVFSPGKLPNTLNIVRALNGISYYRNPIIGQMLKDYKMADKVGRGLQAVMNHHRKNQLRPPDFEATNDYLQVTLWKA
ncbi:MAG: ATP-binding protein [Rhodocyclaceae bacterium]|nr:ATP-binding protein [Rhodocyclaceae bacterium]